MDADLKFLNEAVRASTRATKAEKRAARKAAFELRNTPGAEFAFNAYLILIAAGAPTTEAKILSESKKLARANESHFAKLGNARQGKAAA